MAERKKYSLRKHLFIDFERNDEINLENPIFLERLCWDQNRLEEFLEKSNENIEYLEMAFISLSSSIETTQLLYPNLSETDILQEWVLYYPDKFHWLKAWLKKIPQNNLSGIEWSDKTRKAQLQAQKIILEEKRQKAQFFKDLDSN